MKYEEIKNIVENDTNFEYILITPYKKEINENSTICVRHNSSICQFNDFNIAISKFKELSTKKKLCCTNPIHQKEKSITKKFITHSKACRESFIKWFKEITKDFSCIHYNYALKDDYNNIYDIFIENERVLIDLVTFKENVEGKISNTYRISKTNFAERANCKYVYFFEDEWYDKDKRKLVKNKIKEILHINNEKTIINVNDCKIITKVSKITKDNSFILNNSLTEGNNTFIRCMVYYNDKQVAECDVFRDKESNNDYIILDYVKHKDFIIEGSLLMDMLNSIQKSIYVDSFIVYLDRRFYNYYEEYINCNFKMIKYTREVYYYTNGIERLNKKFFSKSKMRKSSNSKEFYIESDTEAENAKRLGYYRLFDSGKFYMRKDYKK